MELIAGIVMYCSLDLFCTHCNSGVRGKREELPYERCKEKVGKCSDREGEQHRSTYLVDFVRLLRRRGMGEE